MAVKIRQSGAWVDVSTSAVPDVIPTGVIVMWSGSIATIPSGWALCNGSSGTPDLRSRFIVGATSDASTGVTFNADTGAVSGAYAPGNTGGSVAHQLTVAEMPSHTHQVTVPASGKFDVQGNDLDVPTNGNGTYTTTSAGSDDYHENRPPYYALAFIMRTI
jgi:microcystin-dependent protein